MQVIFNPMESADSSTGSQQPHLPPGFRFHPTDEELVVHYLKKRAAGAPLPVAIITDIDLYKFDPWELPAKASFGKQEWYFFSPRDRKYPNGARPNRAATSGYWKATGTDKPVLTSGGIQKVGVKKALVFYGGKPPKGIKTNWVMHEYRLADNNKPSNMKPPGCDVANKKGSLRLDDWVLCRIYKKNNTQRVPMDQDYGGDSMNNILASIPCSIDQQNPKLKASCCGAFLENGQNMFDGMMMTMRNNNNDHGFNSTGSKSQLSLPSNLRTLPTLYWNEECAPPAVSSLSKRFLAADKSDDGSMVARTDDNSSSIATLMQQQAMMGTLGDGVYRANYQLPGMNNWYS